MKLFYKTLMFKEIESCRHNLHVWTELAGESHVTNSLSNIRHKAEQSRADMREETEPSAPQSASISPSLLSSLTAHCGTESSCHQPSHCSQRTDKQKQNKYLTQSTSFLANLLISTDRRRIMY